VDQHVSQFGLLKNTPLDLDVLIITQEHKRMFEIKTKEWYSSVQKSSKSKYKATT
jgi:hypothetical protein